MNLNESESHVEFSEVLFHAMSEAQVMATKVDDDDDLEERMFTDDTVKRLENLLRLAWKLFVCLAFVFILFYWAIAIVHSYSASHLFSRDNAACLSTD